MAGKHSPAACNVNIAAGNPIVVDETTWEPTTYRGISIWGHTREGQTRSSTNSPSFKTGAASLLRDEDVVPALAGAGIPGH
jgi:hypothetical protein